MSTNVRRRCILALLCLFLASAPHASAQQTLGGITGTVTDASGGVIPAATVTIVGDQTKLTRTLADQLRPAATISSTCPSEITRSRSLTRAFKH